MNTGDICIIAHVLNSYAYVTYNLSSRIWQLIPLWESGSDSQPTFIVIVLMASLCMSNLSMGQFLSKFQTIIFESAPPVTNACPVSNKNIVITLTLKLIGSRDKKKDICFMNMIFKDHFISLGD